MKIALINETSQHLKNDIIYTSLEKIANEYSHEVYNYGMYAKDNSNSINYVQTGLLASILLSTKAVDFVVTGCGSGQGASISCNSYPNVICGLLTSPLDAYLFKDVNSGNAVSIPYSQGFGWGSDKNLEFIFEKLLSPKHDDKFFSTSRQMLDESKVIMNEMHRHVKRDLLDILNDLSDDFILEVIDYKEFRELFTEHAQEGPIKDYIIKLLSK